MQPLIKFRAWNSDQKTMHSVTKLYAPNGVCNTIELDGEGAYGDLFPIMQFTGLYDKNGKMTFTKDITEDEHGQRFVVEWDYSLLARMQEIPFNLIGNIYENPELLK